jgi:hypothetical protein
LPPLPHPQQLIYQGEISDDAPVLDTLLATNPTIPRYCPNLFGAEDAEPSSSPAAKAAAARPVDLAAALLHPAAATLAYLQLTAVAMTEEGEVAQETVKAVTHWVVADGASQAGRALLAEAAAFLEEAPNANGVRLAWVAAACSLQLRGRGWGWARCGLGSLGGVCAPARVSVAPWWWWCRGGAARQGRSLVCLQWRAAGAF